MPHIQIEFPHPLFACHVIKDCLMCLPTVGNIHMPHFTHPIKESLRALSFYTRLLCFWAILLVVALSSYQNCWVSESHSSKL